MLNFLYSHSIETTLLLAFISLSVCRLFCLVLLLLLYLFYTFLCCYVMLSPSYFCKCYVKPINSAVPHGKKACHGAEDTIRGSGDSCHEVRDVVERGVAMEMGTLFVGESPWRRGHGFDGGGIRFGGWGVGMQLGTWLPGGGVHGAMEMVSGGLPLGWRSCLGGGELPWRWKHGLGSHYGDVDMVQGESL